MRYNRTYQFTFSLRSERLAAAPALSRTIIAVGLKVAVVPEGYDKALVNQRVATILADEQKVTRDFLFTYLRTVQVLQYIQARVNTLMQPNLSIVDLRRLSVPLPTVVAQQRFNEALSLLDEQVENLISVYCSTAKEWPPSTS